MLKLAFELRPLAEKKKLEGARSELRELIEYYKSCVDPAALREACKLACTGDADNDESVEAKEERRFDPEDGLLRTLSEVQEEYASQYSSQEIGLYWASMAREVGKNEAVAATSLAEQQGNQAPARQLQPENNSDEDGGALGGASSGGEELPGLNQWLHSLKICRHKENITLWIIENGACDLDEIVENLDELSDSIPFTQIEKKRVHDDAGAAASKARQ